MNRLGIFLITLITIPLSLLSGTVTMWFKWHAAYFDADFVVNLGSDLEEHYPRIVIDRANVIIRLDSILRTKKPERFYRWHLVDDYMKSYDFINDKPYSKSIKPTGIDVYFDFTDPAMIKDALAKLWGIDDTILNITAQAGQWMYALHLSTSKEICFIDSILTYNKWEGLDRYDKRPDSSLLWMRCESGFGGPPYIWFQHETDGLYHLYTGLYLTTKNVQEAQKLLKDQYHLETTITSQFLTPWLSKNYMGR